MKHYNIPIFLPELACPFRCVYCNQYSITGKQHIIDTEEVKNIIESYLVSFPQKEREVEVAFFGGNFTGLPEKLQDDYLKIVQPYIEDGKIQSIRCSTRPDYVTLQRMKVLKNYGMRHIELGAQTTNDNILKKCGRGHTYQDIKEASQIILSEDISLGLQMMIGLPYDSFENDLQTAKDIVSLGAQETRIYPCIVVKDTELEHLYKSGEYKPLTMEQAVNQSATLYEFFLENNVKVLRIGLHTSEDLNNQAFIAGPYHPNFAEMVFSRCWRKRFENINQRCQKITINVPSSQLNHAIGWKAENKKMLQERYMKVIINGKDDIEDFQVEFDDGRRRRNKTFIIDARMPKSAVKKLSNYGTAILLEQSELAYQSISSHPDIFFFKDKNDLIYAPNIPKSWLQLLKSKNINLVEGENPIGKNDPETIYYNAVSIGNTLIHNLKHTDSTILSRFENHIHVNQGYTRCNLLALDDRHFITSDQGIKKTLDSQGFEVLYIDPHQVRLKGHEYGFFPGCCGINGNILFICGSTKNLKEKLELNKMLKMCKIEKIELYEGDLMDVGSIIVF